MITEMSHDEHRILEFLRAFDAFASAREVSLGVGDQGRCEKEPNWAEPCLLRLAIHGLVTVNQQGLFRYRAPDDQPQGFEKIHLAPRIAELLAKYGLKVDEL